MKKEDEFLLFFMYNKIKVGVKMIKIILIAYLVTFYISLPGLFTKAGYPALAGFVPIYNIYILVQILDIKPTYLIIIALLLIFLPDRVFIGTMIFVFLPFMISDAYNNNLMVSILGLFLPFLIFPYIAYIGGTYRYDMED